MKGDLEWTSRPKDSSKSKLQWRTSERSNHETETKGWDYVEGRKQRNLDSSSPMGGTEVKREITLTWALHQLLWGGSLFPNHTKEHFLPHHL